MPIGKRTNKSKELGDAGEALTRKYFNLQATSGSGAGAYDKLDCKNEWLRVETKTTEKPEYIMSFAKLNGWRLQAAQDRKTFFFHGIPKIAGKLDWDRSFVACTRAMLVSLSTPLDRQDWRQAHRYCGKTAPVKFFDFLPEFSALTMDKPVETVIEFHSDEDDSSFVVVRAPYFKQLLDKDSGDE